MTEHIPFRRRFGVDQRPPIDADFPQPSRVALYHILREYRDKAWLTSWEEVGREIERPSRVLPDGKHTSVTVFGHLQELPWALVFEFIERVHDKLLQADGYMDHEEFIELTPLTEVRTNFNAEINRLLLEDNFAFDFVNGQFIRPGGLQYQRTIVAAGRVLARPELSQARKYFNKAKGYFQAAPQADPANAVKEAILALESAGKSLFPELGARDLKAVLQQLRGTAEHQIPPALSKVAESLYAFRGDAEGVAHGGASGQAPTVGAAELVLSVAAAYIVYLTAVADSNISDAPF